MGVVGGDLWLILLPTGWRLQEVACVWSYFAKGNCGEGLEPVRHLGRVRSSELHRSRAISSNVECSTTLVSVQACTTPNDFAQPLRATAIVHCFTHVKRAEIARNCAKSARNSCETVRNILRNSVIQWLRVGVPVAYCGPWSKLVS